MNSIAKYCLVLASLTALVAAEQTFHTSASGKEYLVDDAQVTNWFEAQHKCQQYGMQLVEIFSQEEQDEMESVLKPLYPDSIDLWLGGNDEFSESPEYTRPFFWSTSGSAINFATWTSNNPDNAGSAEHCVHIWNAEKTFAWNDIRCDKKLGYICEAGAATKNCKDLEEKSKEASALLSGLGETFAQNQEYLGQSVNGTIQSIEEMEKSTLEGLLMTQNYQLEQVTSMLKSNMEYLTSMVDMKKNYPSGHSDMIKSSIDGYSASFTEALGASRQQIESLLQCPQ